MACDGSTTPGVSYLKENQSCWVFNARVTFYEQNSIREHDCDTGTFDLLADLRPSLSWAGIV